MDRSAFAISLIFILLFAVFLSLETGFDRSNEEQVLFRNNVERQGVVDAQVPGNIDLDWEVEGINKWTHSAAKSSPVITEEGILVGSDTGNVYMFSREGFLQWASTTEPSENGVHGTAAVKNGKVYIGAYDGRIYCYDLETGEELWRTEIGDAIGSSPVLYDGKLYVSVETYEPSGIMAVLDPETGELLWEDTRITDHPHSSVAISPEASVFTVGANDGYLYAWDLETREFKGKFETGGAIKGPIAVRDGKAVFGSWDGNIYSVNLKDLEQEWVYRAEDDVMSGASIGENGTVFIGSHDTRFYAINGSNGEKIWEYDTGGWILGSPTLTENAVLFGSYDNRLYALNRYSGELIWSYGASGDVTSAPAVTEKGEIFFTDRSTEEKTGSLHKLS